MVGDATRVELERGPDGKNPEPGQWSDWGGGIVIACPQCRRVSTLDHAIDEDGNVNPSVVHTPCGWHVWVKLKGWTRGAMEPRTP